LIGDKAMAVEWTITIEGRNDFGDRCRKEVRIDKSWDMSTVSTARTERTSNIQAKLPPCEPPDPREITGLVLSGEATAGG
jgi:hypothetical protein